MFHLICLQWGGGDSQNNNRVMLKHTILCLRYSKATPRSSHNGSIELPLLFQQRPWLWLYQCILSLICAGSENMWWINVGPGFCLFLLVTWSILRVLYESLNCGNLNIRQLAHLLKVYKVFSPLQFYNETAHLKNVNEIFTWPNFGPQHFNHRAFLEVVRVVAVSN